MKTTTNIFGTEFNTNGLIFAFIVLLIALIGIVNNEVATTTELANTLMK